MVMPITSQAVVDFNLAKFPRVSSFTLCYKLNGGINAPVRDISLDASPKLTELHALVEGSLAALERHFISGRLRFLRVLDIKCSYHSVMWDPIFKGLPKLESLRLVDSPTVFFQALPRTLKSLEFDFHHDSLWQTDLPYGGLPPLLETLVLSCQTFGSLPDIPMPPTLTAFSSKASFTRPSFLALLPASITSLQLMVWNGELKKVLQCLPASLTLLKVLNERQPITMELAMLLPRSIELTNLFVSRTTEIPFELFGTLSRPIIRGLCRHHSHSKGITSSQLRFIPHFVDNIAIQGPLDHSLPETLTDLRIDSMDASYAQYAFPKTLKSLTLDNLGDLKPLKRLPSTLSRLVIQSFSTAFLEANTAFPMVLFSTLPRHLFELHIWDWDSNWTISGLDFSILPKRLLQLTLLDLNLEDLSGWSALPKYIQHLYIGVDSLENTDSGTYFNLKRLSHLTALTIDMAAPCPGFGNYLMSQLPPNIDSVRYNNTGDARDDVSIEALSDLPPTLTSLSFPSSTVSVHSSNTLKHTPKNFTVCPVEPRNGWRGFASRVTTDWQ